MYGHTNNTNNYKPRMENFNQGYTGPPPQPTGPPPQPTGPPPLPNFGQGALNPFPHPPPLMSDQPPGYCTPAYGGWRANPRPPKSRGGSGEPSVNTRFAKARSPHSHGMSAGHKSKVTSRSPAARLTSDRSSKNTSPTKQSDQLNRSAHTLPHSLSREGAAASNVEPVIMPLAPNEFVPPPPLDFTFTAPDPRNEAIRDLHLSISDDIDIYSADEGAAAAAPGFWADCDDSFLDRTSSGAHFMQQHKRDQDTRIRFGASPSPPLENDTEAALEFGETKRVVIDGGVFYINPLAQQWTPPRTTTNTKSSASAVSTTNSSAKKEANSTMVTAAGTLDNAAAAAAAAAAKPDALEALATELMETTTSAMLRAIAEEVLADRAMSYSHNNDKDDAAVSGREIGVFTTSASQTMTLPTTATNNSYLPPNSRNGPSPDNGSVTGAMAAATATDRARPSSSGSRRELRKAIGIPDVTTRFPLSMPTRSHLTTTASSVPASSARIGNLPSRAGAEADLDPPANWEMEVEAQEAATAAAAAATAATAATEAEAPALPPPDIWPSWAPPLSGLNPVPTGGHVPVTSSRSNDFRHWSPPSSRISALANGTVGASIFDNTPAATTPIPVTPNPAWGTSSRSQRRERPQWMPATWSTVDVEDYLPLDQPQPPFMDVFGNGSGAYSLVADGRASNSAYALLPNGGQLELPPVNPRPLPRRERRPLEIVMPRSPRRDLGPIKWPENIKKDNIINARIMADEAERTDKQRDMQIWIKWEYLYRKMDAWQEDPPHEVVIKEGFLPKAVLITYMTTIAQMLNERLANGLTVLKKRSGSGEGDDQAGAGGAATRALALQPAIHSRRPLTDNELGVMLDLPALFQLNKALKKKVRRALADKRNHTFDNRGLHVIDVCDDCKDILERIPGIGKFDEQDSEYSIEAKAKLKDKKRTSLTKDCPKESNCTVLNITNGEDCKIPASKASVVRRLAEFQRSAEYGILSDSDNNSDEEDEHTERRLPVGLEQALVPASGPNVEETKPVNGEPLPKEQKLADRLVEFLLEHVPAAFTRDQDEEPPMDCIDAMAKVLVK